MLNTFKMMKNKTYVFTLLLTLMAFGSMAQDERSEADEQKTQIEEAIPQLRVLHKMKDGNLLLRWAPTDPLVWTYGNAYGYIIERKAYDLSEGKPMVKGGFEKMTNTPIKPWPLDDWKVFADKADEYPLIAAQAIYGEEEVNPNVNSFVQADISLSNRFGYALLAADYSTECANASGLFYKDEQVLSAHMYEYKIYLAEPIEGRVDTSYITVFSDDSYELTPPVLLPPGEFEDYVNIMWDDVTNKQYSGYYVERSTDGSTFEALHEVPYKDLKSEMNAEAPFVLFQDSLATQYETHIYRVRGIDPFGDLGPWSKPINAMTRDLTATDSPRNLTASQNKKGELEISWTWLDEDKANDLDGFDVYWGTDPTGYFEKLNEKRLPRKSRSYTHVNPSVDADNYYYVSAIDTSGNVAKSIRLFTSLIDSIPPDPPAGLVGTIDSSGIVSLVWENNQEADLLGYQVYFSNKENTVYTNRSKDYLYDATFRDSLTLKTLTEDIYYYVVALDRNFNESSPSKIARVQKPDTIAPAMPIFLDYENWSNAIRLDFEASKSDDVVRHELWRNPDDGLWLMVDEIPLGQESYTDVDLASDQFYQYKIVAVDDVGNRSETSKKLRLKAIGPYYIPSPVLDKPKRTKEGIALNWESESIADASFMIYRKVGEGKLLSYEKVTGDSTFLDTDIKDKTTYSYAVKMIRKDGKESKLSDVVKAN